MAGFSYAQFNENKAAQNAAANKDGQKLGFFKSLADGETVLVRFAVSGPEELQFATVHKPKFGAKYQGLPNAFAGINCLNSFGSYEDNCPFCRAVAANNAIIDKAKKTTFVPMLVAYKDKATGAWMAPQPVIWERPAGFANELATKATSYGDLKQVLMLMTRTGQKTDTRYSLDYAIPNMYSQDLIPADFSAFEGYDAGSRAYWKKSAEEMANFVITGEFPQQEQAAQSGNTANTTAVAPTGSVETPVAAAPTTTYGAPFVPSGAPAAATANATPAAAAPATNAAAEQPVRNFGAPAARTGFKF